MSLNAAATLSLNVNTGKAAEELKNLGAAYAALKKELQTGISAVGGASQLVQSMKAAQLETQNLQAKMDQAIQRSGQMWVNYSLKLDQGRVTAKRALADMTNDMVIAESKKQQAAEATARVVKELGKAKDRANSLELRVIKAEEAEKVAAATRAMKDLARAKDLANNLELRVIKAEEAGKIQEAARAAKELARAKDLANSLELRVIKAEETGKIQAAARAAKELARAKDLANSLELRVIKAEEAGKIQEAARAAKELARAKNLANSLELRVIKAEEAEKVSVAARAAKDLARAKDQANKLELRVISAEQAAAITKAKKDAEDLARWMALTDKQRAASSLKAGKAYYGGADASMLPGAAGSSHAIAAAKAAGSVDDLQKAHDKLSNSTKKSEEHQLHWNKAANEAHAYARGLSGSLGTLWMTYGSIVPLLAGAAMGAGFVQAAKQGAEFSYQLTFVKALSNEAADAMARLNDVALEMGSASLVGPGQIASGFRILAQAGLQANDAISAMPHVLDLATVGEMDMEQAATTLVGVMNAFNLTVEQSQHVGDIFAKAAALSQTSVQGMTEAMKYASVVGEQYGAGIEDTATAITLLAKVNITGTSAGTAFRNMLKELYSPTKQAGEMIKELGLKTAGADGNLRPFVDIVYDLQASIDKFDKSSQVQILQKIFGERGAKEAIAMMALTREEWNKLRSSISDSEGFMGGVADELENTAQGKWKRALGTMQSELIRAFQAMEPEFANLADQFRILFSDPAFSEGLLKIVSGMVSLLSKAVDLAPKIMDLVQIFVVAKVGTSAYALTMAGASSSALLLGTSVGALAGPLGIVAGLLAGGALAWVLWGDKGKAAIAQVGRTADQATESLRALLEQQQLGYGVSSKSWDVSGTQLLRSRSGVEKQIQRELAGAKENGIADYSFEGGQFYDRNRKVVTEQLMKAGGWVEDLKKLHRSYEDLTSNILIAKENMNDALSAEGELEKKMAGRPKPGDKKWAGGSKDKAGGKTPKDWEFEAEKAAIARLKEQQQVEVTLLESKHTNKLISEEKFQGDLVAIYAEYTPKMEALYTEGAARLQAIVDSTQGEEKKRAQAHLTQLLADKEKYDSEKLVRTQKALDKEQGMLIESHRKAAEAIAKAKASSAEYVDRLRDTRAKQTMSPEQAAAYDAGNKSDSFFKDAETSGKATLDSMRSNGLTEENAALVKQKELLRDISIAKAEARAEAERTAAAEAGYARSYESGWRSAYRAYTDEAANSALTAAEAFRSGTSLMEEGLVQFTTTGKLAYKSMAQSAIRSLAQIAAKQAAMGMLKLVGSIAASFAGGGGSSVGGANGSTVVNTPSTYSTPVATPQVQSFELNALGNVYSSPSLSAFSNGVYNTPKMFAFAKGAGIFAEAGPEAIMPLGRDSQGRLGVRTQGGGGGGSVEVVVNVNIDKNGAATQDTKSEGAESRQSKQLGDMIGNVVKQVIVQEMRSGGMLSRVKA